MQSENPLIADFVKLMNSAAGTLAGMTREAREGAKARFKEGLGGLDFVSREEFDAVKDLAAKAREEVEELKARITALEGKAPSNSGPADKPGNAGPA
jgi:BMFP domain-containing protein YqiC